MDRTKQVKSWNGYCPTINGDINTGDTAKHPGGEIITFVEDKSEQQEEHCRLCGHMIRQSAKTAEQSRINGRRGGRPINENSARQIKLRAKQEAKK